MFQGATNKIAMSTCVVVCSSLLLLSKMDAVTRCDHKNVWQETYVRMYKRKEQDGSSSENAGEDVP